MIIDQIIESKRPFAIMIIAKRLGDDWFAIMAEKDAVNVSGFRKSRSKSGLCECDLDSEDINAFRGMRKEFTKTCIDKNVYVFNQNAGDFKAYFNQL